MMNAFCSDRAHDGCVLQAVAQMAWCEALTLQCLVMPRCPTAAVTREPSPSGRQRGQPRVLHYTSSTMSKIGTTRQTRKTQASGRPSGALAAGHQQRESWHQLPPTTACHRRPSASYSPRSLPSAEVSPLGGQSSQVKKPTNARHLLAQGACGHEPRTLDRGPPGPAMLQGLPGRAVPGMQPNPSKMLSDL